MLGCHIAANKLRTTHIESIEVESPTVKILTFKDEQCRMAKPGQFLMLWIPGVDEIPLSILDVEEDATVSVAVKKVGEATEALHRKGKNDLIGIRGPFGIGFTLKKGNLLLVGGGTGLIPLHFLTKRLQAKNIEISFVIGAKTKAELLFYEKIESYLRECGGHLFVTTEDGSLGVKGLATDFLEGIFSSGRLDRVYACGPEPMLARVFHIAEEHGVDFEASLERLMRCAIGLCGSCAIGKYRVCADGPVFNMAQLREMCMEFGKFKRDFSGRKIPL